jgi:uncharacterized membrane protein YfcA
MLKGLTYSQVMNLFLAFLVSILASFIGVSIGGGGLILIPFLIFLGLSPKEAIATGTVCFITLGLIGYFDFKKAKHMDNKAVWPLTFWLSLSSLIGVFFFVQFEEDWVTFLVAGSLVMMSIFGLLHPNLGQKNHKSSPRKKSIGMFLVFLTGLFKGLVGVGASLFVNMILIQQFGLSFLRAAGTRKIPFLLSNLVTFTIFVWNGLVLWPYALMMVLGGVIGAKTGAYYSFKKGNVWMRRGFNLIVLASAVKLLVEWV